MRVKDARREAAEEESANSSKKRPEVLIAAGVGAALLVGGGLWVLASGAGRTVEPESPHSAGPPPATVLPDYVPPVQGITGELTGSVVEFTWNYPEMQEGMSFIVDDVSPQRTNPQQTVSEMFVTVEPARPSTCISVTALSPGGRRSESLEECVSVGLFDVAPTESSTTEQESAQ